MKDHWGYEKSNEETAIIIRCGNCKHYQPLDDGAIGKCGFSGIVVPAMHFCGWATKTERPSEEIVHCKECRWSRFDPLLNVYWCDEVAHTDGFFCANGRKKKPTQECVGERRSE